MHFRSLLCIAFQVAVTSVWLPSDSPKPTHKFKASATLPPSASDNALADSQSVSAPASLPAGDGSAEVEAPANGAAESTTPSAEAIQEGAAKAATTSQAMAPQSADDCQAMCKPLARPLSEILPNVLVVGDHISSGYFHVVQGLLQQVASVQHASLFNVANDDGIPEGTCGSSVGAVSCIDEWLGVDTVWRVVVFNWGLLDIQPAMDVDEYVARIKKIYVKIFPHIATSGAAVWLSTTPTPPACTERPNTAIQELNVAVEKMWDASAKPPDVEDLNKIVEHACHANATTKGYPGSSPCEQLQDPVHERFNAFGNQIIGMHIAELIRSYL